MSCEVRLPIWMGDPESKTTSSKRSFLLFHLPEIPRRCSVCICVNWSDFERGSHQNLGNVRRSPEDRATSSRCCITTDYPRRSASTKQFVKGKERKWKTEFLEEFMVHGDSSIGSVFVRIKQTEKSNNNNRNLKTDNLKEKSKLRKTKYFHVCFQSVWEKQRLSNEQVQFVLINFLNTLSGGCNLETHELLIDQ